MTKRILYHQCSRTKGSRRPPGTLYCGRPSRDGNPFRGAEAVRQHRALLTEEIGRDPQAGEMMLARWRRYDYLACWCRVGAPCHVQDTLLVWANGGFGATMR